MAGRIWRVGFGIDVEPDAVAAMTELSTGDLHRPESVCVQSLGTRAKPYMV